jgi:hypothetical protein
MRSSVFDKLSRDKQPAFTVDPGGSLLPASGFIACRADALCLFVAIHPAELPMSTSRLIPFLETPAGGAPFDDPEKVAALKRWTVELLGLDDEAVVLVSESRCADPACPLVETVLGVFEEKRSRRWNFARSRYAVSKVLLKTVFDANPDGMR